VNTSEVLVLTELILKLIDSMVSSVRQIRIAQRNLKVIVSEGRDPTDAEWKELKDALAEQDIDIEQLGLPKV